MALVLIVDDRSTNRNIFSRLALSIEEGITVKALSRPVEALTWLESNDPDLIVTDYRMPELDGAAFTQHVRNSINGTDVPIIVITAYDDRTFRLRALEAGATDFISSPVDHCEFVTRARNLLKLSRHQRYIKDRAILLEQELRRKERSHEELIRSSQEALAQVIDTIPAMVSATDREGRAIFVNAHYASFADADPTSLLGQKLADVLISNKRDYADKVDQALFEKPRAQVAFEEDLVDQSGTRRMFLTTKTPMRDTSGSVTSILTTSIDITERKQAEAVLRHIAYHDPLTDLPNRRMLHERVQFELTVRKEPFALHLVDLDRFKSVNDAFGHSSGDRLLLQVTSRLIEAATEKNMVARISGDEFIILQSSIDGSHSAEAFAQDVIARLSTPFIIDGHEIVIGCTIGIALCPNDDADAEKLLKFADLAMYRAKAAGRNTFRFYSPEMNATAQPNLILETDLRKAVSREQLVLHYQPQIDLRTGQMVGAEALLRWSKPGVGLVSPAVFLPLAEESGLIVEIGAWVLGEACSQAMVWRERGLPPMRIAVNLSPVQFLRQDLVQLVADTLAKTGLEPDQLELELTESSLLDDIGRTTETLNRLKKLGVKVSVDDFGIGYSSLTYVKNFPVDRLKIDRSFISSLTTNSRDDAIVRAISGLAGSLGVKMIAEGVETPQQLEWLKAIGCHEAQGYLFSRPVPAKDFEDLLKAPGILTI
ncbi:GGDEF/EAL domain-containing response regulator [Microvirga arsenatis]|uniref:EAL domain-containing protein n=1 Tax=Microvirga arsenatis TaxID=2692265 RepID=A0ABW9Z119_9HYPH|nr:EAL domain-containing protein [Microvirga arsenatis]NBJ11132.1 EAL domain-containing protein [Microvirga arsenatis]NBJ25405.1 EAL domain-containing protein [Microvirga arsenatis]